MNEDTFNLDLRKFLKRFGVTSQRDLENLVREGTEKGTLSGRPALRVRATLHVDGVGEITRIDDELRLA